jgi:hypothetical protein
MRTPEGGIRRNKATAALAVSAAIVAAGGSTAAAQTASAL